MGFCFQIIMTYGLLQPMGLDTVLQCPSYAFEDIPIFSLFIIDSDPCIVFVRVPSQWYINGKVNYTQVIFASVHIIGGYPRDS